MITSKDTTYSEDWKKELEEITERYRDEVDAEIEYQKYVDQRRKERRDISSDSGVFRKVQSS